MKSTFICVIYLKLIYLKEREELFGIFIPFLDAKSMGWRRTKSKWRTNQTDSFPYLWCITGRWKRTGITNCCYLFLLTKWNGSNKKWVPIVSDLCINMAYFSTRLNKLTVKEEIKQEKVNHMITSTEVYGKKFFYYFWNEGKQGKIWGGLKVVSSS